MAKPGFPRERPDIREKPLVPIPRVIPAPAPSREPSYPKVREPVPVRTHYSSADLYNPRRADRRAYEVLII